MSGEPDYAETCRLSANTLVQWVDDLAWSLNGMITLILVVDTVQHFPSEIHDERQYI